MLRLYSFYAGPHPISQRGGNSLSEMEDAAMTKRLGLPLLVVMLALIFAAPAAHAAVRFGVTVGPTWYAPPPYYTYQQPYPYDYYAYPAPVYGGYYGYYGNGHRDHRYREHARHEWREHGRHEHDRYRR